MNNGGQTLETRSADGMQFNHINWPKITRKGVKMLFYLEASSIYTSYFKMHEMKKFVV
uniref:Uncharacterized protein n=1 Tax=Strigamia maritima TaxID=126957 RepID=T1JBQ4_STRMM